MTNKTYLNDLAIIHSFAKGKKEVLETLFQEDRSHFTYKKVGETDYPVAYCKMPAKMEKNQSRILYLLEQSCLELQESVQSVIKRYGPKRVSIILGSTDNGSEQSLLALKEFRETGKYPENYRLEQQEAHYPAEFVKNFFALEGLCASISTACTSSGSAMIMAREWLNAGMADAVICGGADIVSESVLKGFISLDAVDKQYSNPFSVNRKGINMGEGAALFLMTREASGGMNICLAGTGECSDAYHNTAPDPDGTGASRAMKEALNEAGLSTVDYVNLHGTGTRLNDEMEAAATLRALPLRPYVSGTKTLTGHTLGAASAIELAFCWLILSSENKKGLLPVHWFDKEISAEMQDLNFVQKGDSLPAINSCMSNSYAFGGCNVSLILTKEVPSC